MDALKELGGLPFILKGVATAEDAALAVEHGCAAVYISNHGGRELDYGEATIDILPEIVAAVDGNAEIYIDGGFLRGTDVIKALALGANAACIGKLQAWALAAGGTPALVRTLEIVEREMETAMGLAGVTSIDQLSPEYIKEAKSVVPPHEMSAFTHLPGERLV